MLMRRNVAGMTDIDPIPVPIVASPYAPIANALERTFWTYVQALIGLLIVRGMTDNIFDVSAVRIAAIAAIPAAASFLSSALPTQLVIRNAYIDLMYRVTRTYAVTFIGLLVAIVPFRLSYSILAAAGAAAVPAALAVIKGFIASRFGDQTTAATLPARLEVPAVVRTAA
jgi:hypothetical protein